MSNCMTQEFLSHHPCQAQLSRLPRQAQLSRLPCQALPPLLSRLAYRYLLVLSLMYHQLLLHSH